MGYNTCFSGEITITPPLTWREIKDSPWLPERAKADYADVKFKLDEQTIETDDGQVIRRHAVALVPLTDEEYKGYDIVETVQKILDSYRDGHTFTGRFDCEGEQTGDMWRLVVRDGRAVKVEPRIVWPDDSDLSA